MTVEVSVFPHFIYLKPLGIFDYSDKKIKFQLLTRIEKNLWEIF